jgi:hypothetical protein
MIGYPTIFVLDVVWFTPFYHMEEFLEPKHFASFLLYLPRQANDFYF